jgi:hypothetical protein
MALKKKKVGRPKKYGKRSVKTVKVNLSPKAWDLVKLIQAGKRSEFISDAIVALSGANQLLGFSNETSHAIPHPAR